MARLDKADGSVRRWTWLMAAISATCAVMLLGAASNASAQELSSPFGPSITSDKLDYAPGEHVILNGAGWQPGETVSVYVEDDQNKTWFRNVDVTADDIGRISDEFDLPTHFVATYSVTATGLLSGVATTKFTDAAAELQGQSNPACTGAGTCDGGWESGNLAGWAENDLIPMRVKLTGGFSNEPFQIAFDRTLTGSATVFGIESLSNFAAGTGVGITTPTLCDNQGPVWVMCFNVTTSNPAPNTANPRFVTFKAKMAVGAHNFTGSSMAIKGVTPGGMGTVQVSKPTPDPNAARPDLAVTKTCTSGCSVPTSPNTAFVGTNVTYTLAYSNAATAAPANTVVVRDVLSDDETFVSCSPACTDSGGSPRTLSWSLASLAPGASGSVTVTAQLTSTSGVAVMNEGNIQSPQLDVNNADNVSRVTTTTQNVPLHPTSTGVSCSPDPVTYGGTSTCTATVSDTAASGKTAPTGTVTFSNGSASGTFSNATCTLASPTSTSRSCSVSYTPSAVGTGTHTIGASYGGDGTHSSSSGNTGLTVSKATATVLISWNDPQTYDGNTHPATAIVNGVGTETGLSPGATLEYFSGSTAGLAGTGASTAPTNAGTYTVRASFAGNTNYDPDTAVKTITIGKASATVDITWASPQAYNSNTHPATATVDGVGGETNLSPAATFEYFSGSTAGTAGSGASTAPTNAGTYTVRASFAGNGNYDPQTAVKTITIDKATATVDVTWTDPQIYNSSAHPATATVNGIPGETNLSPAATFEYYAGGTAGAPGTGSTTAPKDAGTYTVRASFAGNGNYNPDTATMTIAINKATATVGITWTDPQTYSNATHPATATVNGVSGETNLSPAATLEYYSGSTAGAAGTGTTAAPTNAGTYTVRASFAGNGNYNPDSAVKTITIGKANATVTVTWTSPQTFNGNTHPATATVNGVGGENDLSPAATLEYFSGSSAGTAGTGSATAPTNAGTYTVRASFAGNGNYYSASAVKTVTIDKSNTTTTLTLTPTTVQYSDKVDLAATVSTGVVGAVQFQKSTDGTSYANIGSPVSVASGAAALNNQQVNDAPSSPVKFKAIFVPTDTANYSSSSDYKSLAVTQENAAATYAGPMFMFTPTATSTSVSVPLRATIQDPTALPTSDARYDSSAGEILKASVKFVAREAGAGFAAGATICTATLTLIDASDAKTATATCSALFSTGGGDSDSVRVGIVVGNYYLEDSGNDETVVTVSKPIASQFITGGGYLLLDSTSAGTYKGDAGSKNNFGFNVKYNTKGTNLQGRVNTIIRRGGRVYQVKANNLLTLGVGYCKAGSTAGTITGCVAKPVAPCTFNASSTCPIKATFTGSASIQDVTKPTAPVSIEGGATVQMDMVDWGEPGSNGPAGPDQMGITVWTKTNTLWYSSGWASTVTVMQLLNGGNLVVH